MLFVLRSTGASARYGLGRRGMQRESERGGKEGRLVGREEGRWIAVMVHTKDGCEKNPMFTLNLSE